MTDQKDAVNIGVTLSTQIIASSLTMIVVNGAFATFIIDKRDIGLLYYVFIGGAFIAFIISIIFGGKGIDIARKSGFNGSWTLSETKKSFNWQAITAFTGLILFSISVFIGQEKSDDSMEKIYSLNASVLELRQDIIDLNKRDSVKTKQIKHLSEYFHKVPYELEKIKKDTISNE